MATTYSPELGGLLPSTMSDQQLSIRAIFEHAMRAHPRKQIVSRDGAEIRRFTFAEFGKRVDTFAGNGPRPLELYYAVPMIGAVLHTVNIRLFPDQVAFILDHADDRFVFFDGSLTKAIKAAAELQPDSGRTFVCMGAAPEAFDGALDYETLLAPEPETYAWPEIDERAAAV